jgi:dolichyl-phosphate-mannose-protein mannosyltransferase
MINISKFYQSQILTHPRRWFWVGVAGIFILSLVLHFWNLNQFNNLIFDEVYYAKFAVNYLDGVPLFDAHPPLGKYMIAIGIWIASHWPFHTGTPNGFTGILLAPIEYRWMNALTGSLLPLVVAGLGFQLTHRRSFALIAGFFTATDGLLLVESRLALINIYLVFFGFLGQWLFLLALNHQSLRRVGFLSLAGTCLGASVAVKWNGLGFLLGIYLIFILGWLFHKLSAENQLNFSPFLSFHTARFRYPLQKLYQITPLQILFYLVLIPVLTYSILWIPHLQINTEYNFVEVHKRIFDFHKTMKNSTEVHPYCSNWYTWPLVIRPIVYFFEKAINLNDPVPAYPPLPEGAGKIIYDIHALGNPILWWLSTTAIFILILVLIYQFSLVVYQKNISKKSLPIQWQAFPEFSTIFFITINYLANFLPWTLVTRCTFVYLYMSTSVFSFLALTWLTERWLRSYQPRYQAIGITVIFMVLISLVFWLPVYWGLPLSQAGFNMRMWFRSWI